MCSLQNQGSSDMTTECLTGMYKPTPKTIHINILPVLAILTSICAKPVHSLLVQQRIIYMYLCVSVKQLRQEIIGMCYQTFVVHSWHVYCNGNSSIHY